MVLKLKSERVIGKKIEYKPCSGFETVFIKTIEIKKLIPDNNAWSIEARPDLYHNDLLLFFFIPNQQF